MHRNEVDEQPPADCGCASRQHCFKSVVGERRGGCDHAVHSDREGLNKYSGDMVC